LGGSSPHCAERWATHHGALLHGCSDPLERLSERQRNSAGVLAQADLAELGVSGPQVMIR